MGKDRKQMNMRLIFLDIDGTFIEPGKMEAPASAAEAVRRAREAGHKVFLCTGRNYKMTSPVLRYGFDGFVSSAGGYVVCGDAVLFDCPMEQAQCEGVRAVLEAHGVECTLEARDATYGGSQMIERLSAYQKSRPGSLNSELERWRQVFADGMLVRPLTEYKGEPVYKICYIAGDPADLQPAKEAYGDQFVFCEQKTFARAGDCVNGELINRKFNKGEGIRRICQYLGLPASSVIAFGDSDNDMEMTDVAGISYCMANGSPSLKARCTRVCPPVNEDGIARAFAELGLI